MPHLADAQILLDNVVSRYGRNSLPARMLDSYWYKLRLDHGLSIPQIYSDVGRAVARRQRDLAKAKSDRPHWRGLP